MKAETISRYVTRNPEILNGEPIIIGTRTSVRAIVGLWRLGIMPKEIINHLTHLTLAQVFDALSFYLDHQAEINKYIEKNQVPDELVNTLQSWIDEDDTEEQQETGECLIHALDEDRLSERKLFPTELKGLTW